MTEGDLPFWYYSKYPICGYTVFDWFYIWKDVGVRQQLQRAEEALWNLNNLQTILSK